MPLNPHQESVAAHFKHRALVLAGPGSGKTSTLVERVDRLIQQGVAPNNLLNLSFTNKAANEFKERVAARIGDDATRIKTCTFHVLCIEILRFFGGHLGYKPHMTILDSDDSVSSMQAIARQKFADDETIEITKPKVRMLCSVCNDWRENIGDNAALQAYVDDEKIDEDELAVIREYLRRLKANNQIDFSGMLSESVKLLRQEETIRDRLRERFPFIQVDEYQDTNVAQNVLVELLAGEEDNVLAVGDLDQSIYCWRGANPKAIKTFINNGKGKNGCAEFHLGVNYRSVPEIIESADKLIRHNQDRVAIKFEAHHQSGKPPVVEDYYDPEKEAESLGRRIRTWIDKGINPKDIAVLYRLNDMSRPIEQALMREKVPYKVIGGMGFFDRMVVKDCLAMLRVLVNRKDGSAFSRIAKIKKGVGEKAIGAIENYATANDTDVIDACQHAATFLKQKASVAAVKEFGEMFNYSVVGRKPVETMMEIVQKSGYRDYLKATDKDERVEDRLRHVDELLVGMSKWEEKNPDGDCAEYLQYVTLLTSADDEKKVDTVSLMTGHAAKGLEFVVVCIVGAEEKTYPHERAVKERPEEGLEEERRLFYVMMTRAKRFLLITWCKNRMDFGKGKGKFVPRVPTRFLREAGLMPAEQYGRYEKMALMASAR